MDVHLKGCAEATGNVSQPSLPLIALKERLSLNQELSSWLDCSASKTQGPSDFYLTSAGITGTGCCVLTFMKQALHQLTHLPNPEPDLFLWIFNNLTLHVPQSVMSHILSPTQFLLWPVYLPLNVSNVHKILSTFSLLKNSSNPDLWQWKRGAFDAPWPRRQLQQASRIYF